MIQLTLTLSLDIVLGPIVATNPFLEIRVMRQNGSHDHFRGEGHLGHTTPRWTCSVIVLERLLKVNFSLKSQYLYN